ncbi:heterokaryon incompatibility protein 6, OR allele [Cercophora samala]|uniref:Heterokaryon incompatibility protein 6, OR allele n=1 Tax=Cercophora samala TaxID=330535 RepID=A0AA39Z319_9PEZI|nr:heterokaryon incompatibility protein 6, OR allele [Cercophora samala]
MSRYAIASAWQSVKDAVKPALSEAYYEGYYAQIPEDRPVPEEEPIPDREENAVITEPYQYMPLPDSTTNIRLLRLLPGSRQDDIKCDLYVTELAAAVDHYEALSYVWGDVSPTTPIQVNGGTLQIGLNLRSALLNLRLADEPRTLWIDAICINQQDYDEKPGQINMMGQIYRNASQCVVWLGKAHWSKADDIPQRDTKKAFAVLKMLGDEAAEMKKMGKKVEPHKGDLYKKLRADMNVEYALFENKWWKRVWTAQEIIVAKRAVMVNGLHQMDWDLFRDAIQHGLDLDLTAWTVNVLGVGIPPVTAVFEDVQRIRDLSAAPSSNPADELLGYLIHTRARDATDLRDKIFGVLGFSDGRLKDVGIVPDYRSTVSQVYRDAAVRILTVSGNFDVLGLCIRAELPTAPRGPSWVPDWSVQSAIAVPLVYDALGQPRKTHASKGSPLVSWCEEDGNVMVGQGHVIDVVSSLAPIQRQFDIIEGVSYEMEETGETGFGELMVEFFDVAWKTFVASVPYLTVYVQWENFTKDIHPTNPDPISADAMSIFCQTLCTGTLMPGGREETEKAFHDWLATLSTIRKLVAMKADRKASKLFKTASSLGYSRKTWQSYGSFLPYLTQVKERRMGATAKGYLCLLPRNTEANDQIYILSGGRVPVVLRPRSDGTVEFIGEAYVHGIMDGEAFRPESCTDVRIR